jgi:hypothetical protein
MPDTPSPDAGPHDPKLFRLTLIRVMAVQVATLLLLWLLQTRYSG